MRLRPDAEEFSAPPAHGPEVTLIRQPYCNECKTKARKDLGVIDGIVQGGLGQGV